jgi:hypothetical protein
MKIFLGTLIFALSFPVMAGATLTTQDTGYRGKYQTQPIRLACGESAIVWSYIAATLGSRVSHKDDLPVVSDESARYFIDSADGSWLLLVEYMADRPQHSNLICIIAKGRADTAIQSVGLRVENLPREIVSPMWAVARPQTTTFSNEVD